MKLNARLVLCCASTLASFISSSVHGATVNAVSSGDWSTPGTWSVAEPVSADLATIDGGLTVSITQSGEAAGTIDLGTIATQTGSLTIAAASDLTVSGGGIPSIRVGQASGATGNVTMTGGTADVSGGSNNGFAVGDLLVGDLGTGTWTQSGGDFRVSDEIVIANSATSVGTVSVSGGTFQTGLNPSASNPNGRAILVGFGGNGTLNVSGTAFVRANFDMLVGFLPGATGNVNQSGGTIEAGLIFTNFDTPPSGTGSTVNMSMTGGTFNARIAYVMGRGRGTSTLTHSGGTINVTTNNGDMAVADGTGNTSTYNISGTATVNLLHNFIVGTFEGANGTVNQSGGTITAGDNIRVGADGTGNWNLSGGTLSARNVFLGDFDSSFGTMKVNGGTLNLIGNLNIGGALASNAPPAPTGTQGQALDANGTFIVSDSIGDINVSGNLLANPDDNSRFGGGGEHNDGALVYEILNNSGVSRVDVTGIADLTGADIDVDLLGGTFAPGATFDLITATSITSDYLQVAEDVGVFNLAVIAGGNGQILRATYVPEPASITIVGLAVALALHQRRKR